MEPARELTPADKLRIALELFELGERIQRENLRRRFPQCSDAEIQAKVVEWLQTRPGAEFGDGVGRPCNRFASER